MTLDLSRLQSEFPDYPVSDLPPIPEHWSDESWHNDAAPFFIVSDSIGVFIDYAGPAERELGSTSCRFLALRLQDRQHTADGEAIAEDDDWHGFLVGLVANEFARRLQDDLDPPEFDELQRRNRTYEAGTCASHDFTDANVYMAEAFETVLGREPLADGIDSETGQADAALWGEAWSIAKERYLTAPDGGAGTAPEQRKPFGLAGGAQ